MYKFIFTLLHIIVQSNTTQKFERRKFRLHSEIIPRGKNNLETLNSDYNNKELNNYLQEIKEQHELSVSLPKQHNNDHPLQPLRNKKKSLAYLEKNRLSIAMNSAKITKCITDIIY